MTKMWRLAAVIMVAIACSPAAQPQDGVSAAPAPAAAAQDDSKIGVIEHLAPRQDSTGRAPTQFMWSAAPGADRYVLGVWSEVDQMMWHGETTGTSLALPQELQLDYGTYYWSVSAFRAGASVAESGRAAFVVLER